MTNPEFTLRPERAEDEPALRELAEAIFGPGRFARTPYRVREGAAVAGELSVTAWCGDELAGSIRFTAIRIGAAGGALLLGPLMIGAKWAGKGCGRALMFPIMNASGSGACRPGGLHCRDRWTRSVYWRLS